jgi:drug/metabolite transporter (DMT)-like permease
LLTPAPSAEFVSAGFALASAAFWGAADFSGGVGAKGANAARVVILSQGAGLVCLGALGLFAGEPIPPFTSLAWGAAAGVGAGIGNFCFYRALAIGQMGINASVAAVVTSGLTVLFGIWKEGMPTAVQIGGFALALIAIWLMTFTEGKTKGLALAVCGGVAFSIYLTCSKQATTEAVFWPLVVGRATAVVLLLVLSLGAKLWRAIANLSYIVAAGVLDAIANALFVFSVRSGRLDVATILSAFYPAVTVLCARFILNERVSRRQTTGIIVALISVPLIAGH